MCQMEIRVSFVQTHLWYQVPAFTALFWANGTNLGVNSEKRDDIIAGNLEVPIMAHKVKNPNGLEANHLAIYKRHQGDKLGITENKFSNR